MTALRRLLIPMTVVVLLSTPGYEAIADEFIAGQVGTGRTVMCDTQAQVVEFLRAKAKGSAQARAVYRKYHSRFNAKNEPICALGAFRFVVLEQVYAVTIDDAENYIVKVGTPQRDGTFAEYYILSFRPVNGVHKVKHRKRCKWGCFSA